MKKIIKKVKPLVPKKILGYVRTKVEAKQLKEWKELDCPNPPPHIVKQLAIKEYQAEYQYNIMIETGTYLGQMIEAQKGIFKQVFSIELSQDLFEKAQKRFKNDSNVTIVQGDSGKVMGKVLEKISEPAIFWLDGHYSSGVTAKGDTDCPIFGELSAIFNATKLNHIFLIDDARFFNGEGDYPTIEELSEFIKKYNSNYKLEVKHDILRYTPFID